MSLDPWNAIPTHTEIYDGFDDSILSEDTWQDIIPTGDNVTTEAGGVFRVYNTGGFAGISELVSKVNEYGRFLRISADIKIVDGHQAADGEHCEASIVLYKDANNWIKFGPYRDTSEGKNHAAYLRVKYAGVEDNIGIDISAIGTDYKTFTLMLTEKDVIVYLDGIYRTSFAFPELIGYYCELSAGSNNNTDVLDIHFNDFEVQNHVDPIFIKIGEMLRSLIDTPSGPTAAEIADAVWDELHADHLVTGSFGKFLDKAISEITGGGVYTGISGNVTISTTTAQEIELLESSYGSAFQVLMTFGVSGARCDHCRHSTNSTYVNYDVEANDLVTSDIPLVAASNATVGDIIWFGMSEHTHRLRCVVSPGPYNTDTVYKWVYWNGATNVTLDGVSDGTKPGSYAFAQDGDVTWTTELTSQTLNGQAAYWVGAKITTLGKSYLKPKGSYFIFSSATATDFDSLSTFGKRLYFSVFRKIGAAYGLRPDDIIAIQQSNIRKNMTLEITCFSDTKIKLQLESTPISVMTIPYEGTVATLSE
jgi:hypothetical protein